MRERMRRASRALLAAIRVLRLAQRGATVGRGVRVAGRVWIHGGGRVCIGDGVRIGARDLPVELHAERGAEVVIGRGAEIGAGTSIEAERAVTVGDGARIGRLCKILDTHFHEMQGDRTRRPAANPVIIGAGATVGDRAILLPGARVRPEAVVAPGAVLRGPGPAAAEAERGHPPAGRPQGGLLRRGTALALSDPAGALRILIAIARGHIVFGRTERGKGVRVHGRVRVVREGPLRVGDRTIFVRGMIPTALAARKDGSLAIGESCIFNYGVSIDASSSAIRIGRGCMFGSMVRVHDRERERAGPITIGDDVWLAHGVAVAPGVTVGAGSVISAGSIVVSDVPPASLAAGNPARAIPLSLAVPPWKKPA